jgi:hypothetical protein
MDTFNPSKLNLHVEYLPAKSELAKVYDNNRELVAMFVSAPMAVKKDRYVYATVLLKPRYKYEVDCLSSAFLEAQKRGDYRKFLNLKTRSSDIQYFSIKTLKRNLIVLGLLGLFVLCSLGINLGLMKYLGY